MLAYAPEPIKPEDYLNPCVITLRGPRRVGKSVTLKQYIMRLIQSHHWDPKSIVWFNAETTRTMDRLLQIISRIVDDFQPRLICVDEVSGVLGPQWDEASRAELVVFAELLRHYETRIWEGLSAPRHIFTWKSSSGKEIDALVVDRAEKIFFPVEVKWQDSVSDWDTQVIERAFGRGVIVSKDIAFSRQKSRVMPLCRFLQEFPQAMQERP